MQVFETRLPGVGVRYEFTTRAGDRVGVVVRRDGRREIALYDPSDADMVRSSLMLAVDEAPTVIELLGGTQVTERLSDLRHDVEGLAIEWVTLPDSGGLTGRTIGDGQIRSRTQASVVAVVRGDTSIAGPGPDHRFQPGDVAVVTGSAEAVVKAAELLAG